jgi:hypothetical protein
MIVQDNIRQLQRFPWQASRRKLPATEQSCCTARVVLQSRKGVAVREGLRLPWTVMLLETAFLVPELSFLGLSTYQGLLTGRGGGNLEDNFPL